MHLLDLRGRTPDGRVGWDHRAPPWEDMTCSVPGQGMTLGNSATDLTEYLIWHVLSASDRKAHENSSDSETCVSPSKMSRMSIADLANSAAQSK